MSTTTKGAASGEPHAPSDFMDLLDWRRRMAELYTAVRWDKDPEAACKLWRQTRDKLFANHPQMPLDAGAWARNVGLSYFDYDPRFRFHVTLEAVPRVAASIALTGPGGTLPIAAFAVTRGLEKALGKELTLFWLEGYGGGVFLPFLDATSGDATYGGGRYLLDSIKGADLGHSKEGALILDFNFAYNPSCSYSDRWACPLAPEENRFPKAVTVGERLNRVC